MEPAVRTSIDADNVLTILLDLPGKPVNTCSPQLLEDLSAAVESLAASKPVGVIVASAKARSFNAGADLYAIRDMDPDRARRYLATGQALFERIARLPMPTVAAINGDCLGGGMELALACTYRVAADDGSITIGLPEVKLGLIPAWRGATWLPRMIGLTRALPILLEGKTMPPRRAKECGLVDEIVPPVALRAAAKRWVTTPPKPTRAGLGRRFSAGLSPVRNRVLSAARARTVERTFGNYPAPLRLLDVVKTGYEHGFEAGLAAEREAILQLMQASATRNLLRLFFLRQGAKRRAAAQLKARPSEVNEVAVVSRGATGSAIAHALTRAGLRVRQVDSISPSTADWATLATADVVIEAEAGTLGTAREIFARMEGNVRPNSVLATSSKSHRISDVATAVTDRGRVIGLHFFDPVDTTPLIEIVRGPESGDAALATGVALVNRTGKTPIVVADAPGFLVDRLLIAHLQEAFAAVADGASLLDVDDAMKRWGMINGPFGMMDEIGLDVVNQLLDRGGQPPPVLRHAVTNGWLGRKSGKGFYVDGRNKGDGAQALPLNSELARLIAREVDSQTASRAVAQEDLQWRLILPMVNEAARALSEGVTDSADDIDLAAVLGLGFPPFRGGLAKFVDDTGVDLIVRRLDQMVARHGPRFATAELLRTIARDHDSLPRPKANQ